MSHIVNKEYILNIINKIDLMFLTLVTQLLIIIYFEVKIELDQYFLI